MTDVTYAGAAVGLALLVAATGFVVTPAGGDGFQPVQFDETLRTGLTGVDVQQARAAGHAIPRAQVFYAQYEYVVGYYSMEALAAGLGEERRSDQFGQPLAIFVTDFADTGPTITDDGAITLSNSLQQSWVRAGDAWFVVDTPARTVAGPTAVPFGDRDRAAAFADSYDGSVVGWKRLQDRLASRATNQAGPPPIDERHRWANETVERAQQHRQRPVSVVVGEDVPTLAAAVDVAPPNTTVRLPAGRYRGNLTVEKPLTLRGRGGETVVTGDGNGTVLTVDAPNVAITDVHVTGVGDVGVRQGATDNGSDWDRRIRLAYGYGDAAVRLSDAHHSLVENVSIETPANGIVALNSSGAVVRNVTVDGSERWEDGFMSVLAMYSRMVVEDSTFRGGRDAVYTHYADGTIVRDNVMTGMRYGLHEMYTSHVMAADNTMRDTNAGIILMTRPVGNVQVGNDVRDSELGIGTVGASSYTLRNTLVDNQIGLSIGTSRSVYRENTVVGNDVGVRSATLLPTNEVVRNDVLGNDQAVGVQLGTLNVWAVDGRGNYWGAVPGFDRDGDGVIERTYRPANAVDRSARTAAGGHALSRAPALDAIRQFQRSLPGLRKSTVIDPQPLASPARPDVLAALNATEEAT
jgi:nitrous oxidase accessory protein NosD/nitrous oxide reductase accessory protein NosL